MHLAVEGEAVSFQPLDQVHLPQRAVQVELVAVQARDEDSQLALAARMRQRGVAHVVLEIDIVNFAHQGNARSEQGTLDQFQVPGRRDRVRLAHALQLLPQVVGRRVIGQRELEQAAHVHGRVARLQREPCGIEWGNLLHRPSSAAPPVAWCV